MDECRSRPGTNKLLRFGRNCQSEFTSEALSLVGDMSDLLVIVERLVMKSTRDRIPCTANWFWAEAPQLDGKLLEKVSRKTSVGFEIASFWLIARMPTTKPLPLPLNYLSFQVPVSMSVRTLTDPTPVHVPLATFWAQVKCFLSWPIKLYGSVNRAKFRS